MSGLRTRAGSPVQVEHSDALPVVGVGISLRTGSLTDPEGKEGLTRMLARAMRMGTRGLSSVKLEETIDAMGAQLSMGVSQSYAHFGGVVVKQNLERYLELLGELLLRPAFRAGDVALVKRETKAELTNLLDEDRALCFRNFRTFAFGDHPYARSRMGSPSSVRRIGRDDLRGHHKRLMRADNLVIGVWGDFDADALMPMLDRVFGEMPRAGAPSVELPAPRLPRGRRVLLIDKPERTQTQIAIGTLGTHPRDREHVPLLVGNTSFGGLFTSRLTTEVRGKRGWSYGANSSLTQSLTRDLWAMHTYPAAADARACIELQLSLLEDWIARGVTARELRAAQSYLAKGHAFEVDTPAKRLDRALDDELFNWPRHYHERFVERVRAVTREDIQTALRRRLSARDLVITLVATADQLLPELEKLPEIASIEVRPFDQL